MVFLDQDLSEQRQLLIGAYFVSEFSVESAALFNPSMVADPDQQGLPPGALRFVLSLRATGMAAFPPSFSGQASSLPITGSRSGLAACCIVEPSRIPNTLYENPLFELRILELGLTNEHTRRVMERLGDSFTVQELQSTIETELKECSTLEGEKDRQDTAQRMSILAKSNCSVQFSTEQGISERVIFPVTLSQRNGIEDARFVRFLNDDGTYIYFATFAAFDGQLGIPQLLETSDFLLFRFATLNGPAVQNKGMALFPKKVNGLYAMLSRQDSENIYLMFSDNVYFWCEPRIL